MTLPNKNNHWLVRPATVRGLWWGGAVILVLTVGVQFVVPFKGYFGIDGWPAFGAVFGFAACAVMVVLAKLLGYVLKRDERYYAQDAAADRDDPSHG